MKSSRKPDPDTPASNQEADAEKAELVRRIRQLEAERQGFLALQKEKQKYRTVANFTYAMETWMLPDGSLSYVSPSAQRITGHSAREFQEIPGLLLKITHPDDRQAVAAHLRSTFAADCRNLGLDFRILTPSGETRWLSHSCTAVYDEEGNWLGRRGSFREITKRKEAEEKNIQLTAQQGRQRKRESLGRMAGAIAHHFNNKLHVIVNHLEFALAGVPPDEPGSADIQAALTAANEAAEVSRRMLIYLGQVNGNHTVIDLARTCRERLPGLRAKLPERVTLSTSLPDPGPRILGDPGQVGQILHQLIQNAAEALAGEGGDIRLRIGEATTADIEAEGRYPGDWTPAAERHAMLQVSDSGSGLDREELEVIFDPFYSTKSTGRGMGLCLVLGLARAHHGLIGVTSRPGQGSVFAVYFPLVGEPLPESRGSIPESTEQTRPRNTVLIADDDRIILKLSAALLEKMGYRVITASDGLEAVALFKQHRQHLDFVLSDFAMPGLNGLEALQIMRDIAPETAMILVSGYGEEVLLSSDYPEKPQVILAKPYDLDQMRNAIRQLFPERFPPDHDGSA